MYRNMLFAKLHRATVTQAELYYEGSITIDADLLDAVGLVEFEQVDVVNINNGQRFTTYVIKGDAKSGMICVNGAAARQTCVGDHVIIMAYASLSDEEWRTFKPKVAILDSKNAIKSI